MSPGFVDRVARRPSGWLGRLIYRYPLGEKPCFDLALRELGPRAGDHILEVGCGGGVFLRRALTSGCRATGGNHSPDMLAASTRLNARALRERRLVLHRADAAALPVTKDAFDKAYCLNAFFFFPDPHEAVREMARPCGRAAPWPSSPPHPSSLS
ncbi:class I SAM-dependent methyltransferase [Pseudogemmobacter sonorensis]|uniref:class I SAM-dependent methyltransferase n=1 Tax=Pseudogemmobacter sonorensis TaxID=2989681 RepID=UPI003692D1B1